MIKFFFLYFIFIFNILYGKEISTCYTIQLLSTPYTQEKERTLLETTYPKECRTFHIGDALTVRCGCYNSIKSIKPLLKALKEQYKNPFIRTTYKYRFKQKIKNKVIQTKKEQTKIPINNSKKNTCYTIQLLSIPFSKTSQNSLLQNNYPQECQVFHINHTLTVRCGCFQYIKPASSLLTKLKSKYKKAFISTTYSYRFSKQKYKKQQKLPKKSFFIKYKEKKYLKNDYHDNELRLMYQSFIYSKDLSNAMKVASIGVKRYPKSIYWNQKMAESAQWNTKTPLAMKYMKRLYALTHNPKLAKQIINYSLKAYQYEEAEPIIRKQFKQNPSEKNLKLLLFIYDHIGEPEKSITVLEEAYKVTKKKSYLIYALRIALEIGDLQRSKQYIKLLQTYKPYAYEDALLIARYYYITKQLKKAYNVLIETKETDKVPLEKWQKKIFIAFHKMKSDMAWYYQDIKTAALSSLKVIQNKKGRAADYDRTIFYFSKINPLLTMQLAKKAYLRFHLSYFFYTYANIALDNKQYKELYTFFNDFDEKNDSLSNEAMYWIIKSQDYEQLDYNQEAKDFLLKALTLDKNNYQIKLSLIWFLMDLHEINALKEMLAKLAEDNIDSSFYFPIASAYFSLSDMNKAVYYLELLKNLNDPIIHTNQYKFLRAYLYQIQNNPEAFLTLMRNITHTLWKEANKNPNLKHSHKFWSDYLRAAMYILHPDIFEQRLKEAKPYLKQQDYIDISYSWATMRNANDEAMKIYYSVPKHELWINFSHASLTQNHSKIENLLDLYLDQLSMGDAVQAAYKDGQTALAQTIAFEGMSKNQRNQNVYIKHIELAKERGDFFDAKIAYLQREPLLQNYIRIKNKTYLRNDYFLHLNIAYADQSSMDNEILMNVPKNTYETEAALQKVFARGFIQGSIGYNKKIKNYGVYKLKLHYIPYRNFSFDINLNKNTKALESVQLMIAGKKDTLSSKFTWNILPSTYIELYGEYANYSSDDNINIGDGTYIRTALSHMIHNGYPDMFVYFIADTGIYNENTTSKGVIDSVKPDGYTVLPLDFYNIGFSFSYGMQNSYIYTRVWRPYFYITSIYNNVSSSINYDFNIGIGGKIFHQDHLDIGFSYSEYFKGINDTVMQLYLNYKLLYFHP